MNIEQELENIKKRNIYYIMTKKQEENIEVYL